MIFGLFAAVAASHLTVAQTCSPPNITAPSKLNFNTRYRTLKASINNETLETDWENYFVGNPSGFSLTIAGFK
ncbi:hypothetical protein GQ53DRAFT_747814 [Thozetella sp. PMI_491]|nr:hypothetical protein GQ53DRAFT_747814 [Thozetella sp. PMI_491]